MAEPAFRLHWWQWLMGGLAVLLLLVNAAVTPWLYLNQNRTQATSLSRHTETLQKITALSQELKNDLHGDHQQLAASQAVITAYLQVFCETIHCTIPKQ